MADTQINVGMNVDGVITGTDKAKRKIGELGGAAREAGRGTGAIGDGMAATSQKVEAATKSLVSSIQRTTALMDAGARGSAEYYKALANQRGVDTNALKPYLDQLEAVKVKQSQAAAAMVSGGKSLDNVGISAQQTAAALRGVPAQLTDIVVSLQGGQAPMTVLLQQGGQLKDMFGGIGPAARALGGYVMGMVNPFTAAAAAGATLAVAAYQGAQESKAFTDTLITTGNQAGVTAGRLMLMAQSLDSVAGTQGNAAAVLNQLAATGQVTAAGLQLAAQAAIEFERAGGQAAEKTVQGFAELGKAPLAATIKLNESMGYLTSSTYEQIKSLEEQGRTADAAALAQKAFADALLTRAPEMLANMGYLETGWVNIKDAVKEAWDGIKNIGRDAGVDGQSAAVGAAIARLEGVIRTKTQGGYNTQMFDAELAKLKERQSILQSDERLLRSAADHQAQQTREVEARVKWDKDGAQYLDKKVKMEREITQAISEGTKAKATQADIDARVAAIREKYKEKAGPKTSFVPGADNAREWETYMKAFGAAAVDAEGKVSGLTKTQGKLIEYLGSGAYLNMPEPARQTALQAAYAAIATEQQVEATKHQAQAWTEANKSALAYGKQLDDMALAGADLIAQATSYAAAIDQQVAATEFEASLIGQSNVQRGIALKQYQIELETKKEIARINATLASQADRDAAISAVMAAGDKAKASAAAEVVNQEFNRVSAQIEQSLTDALMRGFESGKGFAENLRDTVANMFKTLVLRPVVQAIVSPVAGSITSALGVGAQGVNALNMGSSLYSAGSTVAGWLGLGASTGTGIAASAGTGLSLAASSGGLGLSAGAGTGLGLSAATGGGLGLSASSAGAASLGAGSAGAASLSAALPWIGAGLAVLSLIDSLDDSGTMHTGGLGGYSAKLGSLKGSAVSDAGLRFGVDAKDYSASSETAASALAKGVAGILDQTAATFGKSAGYYAATAFADDTSADGAWGALMVKLGDKVLLDWGNNPSAEGDANVPRVFSDGAQGATEYAAAVAGSVRDLLIEQTPDWADTMLMALGDAPTIEQLAATVGQINQVQTALTYMGDASTAFAGMGTDAANALIGAMGGAQQAIANLQGYYTNFYSETERQDLAKARLTETLGGKGIDLPGTRAAYRELVDNTLASGDTDLAAFLIEQSAAYAEITPQAQAYTQAVAATTPVVDEAAKAMEELAKKFESAKDSLADAGASLAVDLLTAQGDTAGAAALQRSQYLAGFADLDAARLGELATIYDQNQAIRDQITAVEKANAVAEQRKDLERQILEATGDIAAVRALELAALDESLRPLQERIYALADEAAAIEKAKAAMEAWVSAADSAASTFLSGSLLETFQNGRIADQLNEALGSSFTGADLAAVSIEQIKAAVLGFVSSDAAPAAKTAVVQLGQSLIGLKQTALDTAKTLAFGNVDTAYATLERSVAAQRKTLETSSTAATSLVSEIKSIFDALKSNVTSLYDAVDSTRTDAAATAQQSITQALAVARATGALPDAEDISAAMSAAISGINATQYSSQAEADFARIKLAGELRELQDISGDQLTEAEKQLDLNTEQLAVLDGVLESAQAQVNALKGIDTSVISVESAIANLAAAVTGAMAYKAAPGAGTTSVNPNTGAAGSLTYFGANGAQFEAASGIGYQSGTGLPWLVDDIRAIGVEMLAAGQDRAVIAAIKSEGYTHAQAEQIFGLDLPQFDVGTNYVPRDMLAQVHRGEMIVPEAYNPATSGIGQNNARLEALVEGLTAEVKRLQAIVNDGNTHQRRTADTLENVTEGGANMRTVTA